MDTYGWLSILPPVVAIGLAIAARIVKLMGGRIEIDSAVDQGSTFSFTVPVPREAPDRLAEIEAAGGKAIIFGTPVVSDGISMGTEAMIKSLIPC